METSRCRGETRLTLKLVRMKLARRDRLGFVAIPATCIGSALRA
jgi:hypothetical protein